MGAVAGEYFVSGFGYEDVVFNSHAEFAADVYAGFYRDDLASFKFAFAAGFEEGRFVDFQAEAVTCAVAVDGQIGFGDGLAGRRVNLGEPGAGSDFLYRRGLGLLDDVEDRFEKRGRGANRKTPGNVTAIATVSGAEVNEDVIFLLELSSARLMMGPGGIGTESDDCLEAVARAQLADLKIEHARQLAFADAGLYVRQSLPERLSRYRSSGFDGGNFTFVFDDPRRFDDVRRGSQSRFYGLFQLLELGHRCGFLNGYRSHGFQFRRQLSHRFGHRPGAVDYLAARAFLLRLLGVSAVSQKIHLAVSDGRPAIVAQKAGGVSNVGRPCHYQAAYSLLGQLTADRSDAFTYHFSIHFEIALPNTLRIKRRRLNAICYTLHANI